MNLQKLCPSYSAFANRKDAAKLIRGVYTEITCASSAANSSYFSIKPILSPFFKTLPLIAFFLATLYTSKDFDLGWHLKYGEYFVQNYKILTTNIYSTTMQEYRWISSSWALDPLLYIVFDRFGFLGLSILGATIATLIFYVIKKAFNLQIVEQMLILLFLFSYLEPVINASIRGQVVSLLFLAILLAILRRFEKTNEKKLLLFLWPLFFLWVNLHTQYIVGLGITTIWIALDVIRKRISKQKINTLYLVMILQGCFLITLINPRGIRVFEEVIKHFNHPSQKFIVEWLAFKQYSMLWRQFLAFHIVLQGVFVLAFFKKKFLQYLPYIGVTAILMVATWLVRRYAWSLVIVASFLIIPFLKQLNLSESIGLRRFATIVISGFFLWVTLGKLPQEQALSMSWEKYCTKTAKCSRESAEFLLQTRPKGKLWTYYGYGGWLIWNYPKIKPSMDGRMPSWIDKNGYSAFLEYYEIEQARANIDESEYDVAYTIVTKPIYNQLLDLEEQRKWKTIYEDEYAAIFVRTTQPNTNLQNKEMLQINQ